MNSGWHMYMVSKCIVFPSCVWSHACFGNFQMLLWGSQGEGKLSDSPRYMVRGKEERSYCCPDTSDVPFSEWVRGDVRWQDMPCHPGRLPGLGGPSPGLEDSHLVTFWKLSGPLHRSSVLWYIFMRVAFLSVQFFPTTCLFPFSFKSSVPVSYSTHHLSIACFEMFCWLVFLSTGIKIVH